MVTIHKLRSGVWMCLDVSGTLPYTGFGIVAERLFAWEKLQKLYSIRTHTAMWTWASDHAAVCSANTTVYAKWEESRSTPSRSKFLNRVNKTKQCATIYMILPVNDIVENININLIQSLTHSGRKTALPNLRASSGNRLPPPDSYVHRVQHQKIFALWYIPSRLRSHKGWSLLKQNMIDSHIKVQSVSINMRMIVYQVYIFWYRPQ